MNSDPTPEAFGLDPDNIPAHVAVIMDGNGRWARKRLLNRVKGHERGADVVREVVTVSREIGVSYLTLYAFSTENWARPKSEVSALMALLTRFIRQERQEMMANGIRFNTIGQIDRLPAPVGEAIQELTDATRHNGGMVLTLALSYGGRSELIQAVQQIVRAVADGDLAPEAVSEEIVSQHLYTGRMPDPDLLIRTSGEQRISNFLLWQLAYSELIFTPTLWPDFNREEFLELIRTYQGRQRRFGRVT